MTTDKRTTPEYRAWVDAKRPAVEAQWADLEAAIRRLEQSLEADARSWRTSMGKTICR